MKKVNALSFNILMAYAEGKLKPLEARAVEAILEKDDQSRELVKGLKSIYKEEGHDSTSLALAFAKTEALLEKRIKMQPKISNHLIGLNRQLLRAAAVLIFVFSFSFLVNDDRGQEQLPIVTLMHGPYDLALGKKVAP